METSVVPKKDRTHLKKPMKATLTINDKNLSIRFFKFLKSLNIKSIYFFQKLQNRKLLRSRNLQINFFHLSSSDKRINIPI